MNKVLTAWNIDMAVRIRVLKCYVWSTLLYGCEAWTLSSVMMKKLEAFETWLYRKNVKNIMERQDHQMMKFTVV